MDPVRILIVEDEAIVSRAISRSLEALGYVPVGWAITGEEALAGTREHGPELVLMDIRLPGEMDGIDAAMEIRRKFCIPVIFLTAHSDDESLKRAKLAQPYGYILKPFDDRELKSTIEMALHKHRADEEIRRLSRLYNILSQVNQAIVRSRSDEELLSTACRVVVERGGADSAWIGLLTTDRCRIAPIAHFGVQDKDLSQAETCANDLLGNPCDMARAIGEGRYFICDQSSGRDKPCSAMRSPGISAFEVRGWFPFHFKNEHIAVLCLTESETGFFGPREIEHLQELVAAISFALDKFEADARQQAANEALRASEERLQEGNAALKVLLKQREEDRAELEESLLENVRRLVLPYLEKLRKTRPTEDQKLYLEIIESHLKEITSPFLRRASSRFLGLTSTEMRVADLIRQGKTSKEIAHLLGTAETTVLTQRQSIRGKLGLRDQKVNLQNFLNSLND